MSRRLIINADGYGFTPGITRGIEESVADGVVTSISVNSNFDAVWPLEDFIGRYPQISVGVHLNPIVGRPIADPRDVPTLVTRHGEFHFEEFTPRLQRGQIDRAELTHELGLQIERVQQLVPTVTHLDSHENRHLWPRYFGVFLELARTHGIPRMRTHARQLFTGYPHRGLTTSAFYVTHPKRVQTHGFARLLMWRARRSGMRMCDRLLSTRGWKARDGRPLLDAWLRVATGCPPGRNEIFCHPGYVDNDLRRWDRIILERREEERQALIHPLLRQTFGESGVELISFHEI